MDTIIVTHIWEASEGYGRHIARLNRETERYHRHMGGIVPRNRGTGRLQGIRALNWNLGCGRLCLSAGADTGEGSGSDTDTGKGIGIGTGDDTGESTGSDTGTGTGKGDDEGKGADTGTGKGDDEGKGADTGAGDDRRTVYGRRVGRGVGVPRKPRLAGIERPPAGIERPPAWN